MRTLIQLYIILTFLSSAAIRAQNMRIIDLSTRSPLPEASVKLGDSDMFIRPDFKGEIPVFRVSDVTHITVSCPGYEPQTLTHGALSKAEYLVEMSEAQYQMDEVVLSASKFEEKRKDVAQNIHVMKSKEIAFASQGSTADVMANIPGVMVQKSQLGGGSPIIRGFEANKVLMVIDGVRLNNAIYRGGHLQNVITMDNAAMDRVEVVYGPGSVIYGSDALGGVMHFHTKKPLLSTDERLRVEANSFVRYATAAQEKTAHADISLGTQRFGSLTSFTLTDFNDLRQGSVRSPFAPTFGNRSFYQATFAGQDSMVANADTNLQVGSGYTQWDVMQKFLFQQRANIRHSLNLQYSSSSDIPRYDRLATLGGNGLPTFAEWYYGPQERLMAAYTLALSESKIYDQARITAAYQAIQESRHDRRFGSVNLNHRTENVAVFTLNADLSKRIQHHEIRYGAEATHNRVKSTAFREKTDTGAEEPLNTRYPDGGATTSSLAAYLSHAWEISPKLILNDGLRLSHTRLSASFTDTTFFPFPFQSVAQANTSLNGNLGLIFMPGHHWRATVSAATGFRAPNVDDLAKVFDSQPGTIFVPNPTLKPEQTYSFEAGLSKTIAGTLTLSGTAFYTIYDNLLTANAGTFQGQDSILYDGVLSQVLSTTNGQGAYLYGFEAQAQVAFTAQLRLLSSVTYTHGRIRTYSTPYPLDHVPPTFGRTSLQWQLRKLRTEVFAQYSAWKRLEDYNLVGEDNFPFATPQGMPAWWTLNFRASWQALPQLAVQVSVENILDHNYRVFASNISAPGRNFILTLRGTL